MSVPEFLNHLRTERRLSPHTVSAYARDLAAFQKYREAQAEGAAQRKGHYDCEFGRQLFHPRLQDNY